MLNRNLINLTKMVSSLNSCIVSGDASGGLGDGAVGSASDPHLSGLLFC